MASKLALKRLSSSVYYVEPALAAGANGAKGPGKGKAPELVLVSSWMDAQIRHIEKYLASYRELYPTASILLIRSDQRDFYSLGDRLARSLSPAVDLIRAHAARSSSSSSTGAAAGPESNILVHVFSNGGCMSLKELNELLRRPASGATRADGEPRLNGAKQLDGVPARCIVFDSCPGHSTLRLTLRAFTAGMKSRWLKLPVMAFFSLLYGGLKLIDIILRRPPALTRLSAYLNSPALPPVPRLYLYSHADALVPGTDVEAHAAQAKAKGAQVRMERFDGTAHVAHARKEGERYWAAVERSWEESGRV
ncbi:hypothetical protein JCM10213_000180 [Rhodosporidiobolus nylandii]